MVKFSWKILRVDCYQTITDGNNVVFNDVIYAVQWQLLGENMVDIYDESTQETYSVAQESAWVEDVVGFDTQLSSSFVERSAVNQDTLVQWVIDKLGAEYISTAQEQIIQMLNAQEQ
jgi:hypothetical protein